MNHTIDRFVQNECGFCKKKIDKFLPLLDERGNLICKHCQAVILPVDGTAKEVINVFALGWNPELPLVRKD